MSSDVPEGAKTAYAQNLHKWITCKKWIFLRMKKISQETINEFKEQRKKEDSSI